MSQGSSSTGLRMAEEVVGKETGLPLIRCPFCGKARVHERRSRKDNVNNGRVYFKCPRGDGWMADRCKYYKWQREYFCGLVNANVIKVADLEHEQEIEEEDYTIGMKAGCMEEDLVDVKMQKEEVQAKLDLVMKLVFVLFVFCVGIIAMFFGYVMNK